MKTVCIAGPGHIGANYARALRRAGFRCFFSTGINEFGAFPARNAIVSLSAHHDLSADALLLPGGGDIDPSLFYEVNKGSVNIDAELDKKQLALLHQFVTAGKPILGICKGMQLINVYFGGGIIQHLPTAHLHTWNGEDRVHMTAAVPGSILAQLYGKRFQTNSAHHQAIGRPGEGLKVIQYAEDRVAEAICHESLPILGVQWHPERLCLNHRREGCADGLALFQRFYEECSSKRRT